MYVTLDIFLFVMRSCSVKALIYFQSDVHLFNCKKNYKKQNYEIFAVDIKGMMAIIKLIQPLIAINSPVLGVQQTCLVKPVNQGSGY